MECRILDTSGNINEAELASLETFAVEMTNSATGRVERGLVIQQCRAMMAANFARAVLNKRKAAALVYSFLWLGSLSVFGQTGGGIMLTISNNTSDNLLVTIYDVGVSPRQTILSNRAIYGNASITVSISEDASGSGHVYWTAMSQDSDMRMCGHEDKANLKNGDAVSVYADGDCSG
jgi:hypothetical protein